VPDFAAFAALAKKHDLPLIVDNTFGAGGAICQPLRTGRTSSWSPPRSGSAATARRMGGVIVDAGTFNWGNGKYPQFTSPSPSYHGLVLNDVFGIGGPFGNIQFIIRCRIEGLRDWGPAQSPFNSFLLLQGLETLSLRVERTCENALALARWLAAHPGGHFGQLSRLGGSPVRTPPRRNISSAASAACCRSSSRAIAPGPRNSCDSLKLISHLANVGDAKTLIIHPASTTHSQLVRRGAAPAGVAPGGLRVSLGIEHIDDIKADIEQALKA
jgi:O-acetylhomoserine/O-acetylserine sulfhydrylase